MNCVLMHYLGVASGAFLERYGHLILLALLCGRWYIDVIYGPSIVLSIMNPFEILLLRSLVISSSPNLGLLLICG